METINTQDTAEAWEAGALGASDEFVGIVSDLPGYENNDQSIDETLGLQLISIRLPKQLIEDYKMFAKREAMGYQPLMREVLKRWVENEMRMFLSNSLKEQAVAESDSEAGARRKVA